ncbi:hypothetical protein SCLCIDRAFT_124973 [Scleroderma citrinum Foug A]|uniref:Uncharacterized protein n=1 Tax=Scleroderma citrinum Foug A TaxID=1036808 RepID=A0A0C3DW51_9AGAM|nr:hypothetical protein SCLCIDRAFT_124973 [Scleroderma citrinum Foug A]
MARPLSAPPSSPPAFEPPSDGHRSQPIPLEDDLPPAYTPAPDPTLGEATVEVGPRRPFQPPRHPLLTPHPTGHTGSVPQANNTPWHQTPGQAYHSGALPPSSSAFPQQQPNGPQHHTWQSSHMYSTSPGYPMTRTQGGGGLIGSLIDTVRDVVDVISGAHDERLLAAQRASAGAYSPSNLPAQEQYSPPPAATSASPPSGSQATNLTPRSPTSMVPDDGSPTRTPVPGHPLLRDEMLLVYPKDYFCPKCRNTGYKDYDPTHPCRRCWEKYAKPYTGALVYAPWSSSAADASTSRMQRPLPRTPQRATSSRSSRMGCIVPPPQSSTSHARSVSQPILPLQPQHSGTGLTYYVHNPMLGMGMTPPVPYATPVSPGDPRLGGRICFRCGGSGMRVQMLIDLTTCQVCGGIGRLWS